MLYSFVSPLILWFVLSTSAVQGDLSCFKKYRQKLQNCGGLYKKKTFVNADECCNGFGSGFTIRSLEVIGRNKYTCVSCEEWDRQKNTPDPETVKEEFHCFRRFRDKKKTCGGPVKKRAPTTPEDCCTGNGNGFSRYGLNKLRKNQYTCISCEEWRDMNNTKTEPVTLPSTTTTEKPWPADWSHWGECSTSCGFGTQIRYRTCFNCDRNHHDNYQIQDCVINFYCPVHGGWGSWSAWEHCSVSCDGGFRRRRRECDTPRPKHGGRVCMGADMKEESCNTQLCPVDGHWGQWSRFGRCSATCGLGTMERKRECNSPAPKNYGKQCEGPKTSTRRCEQRKCPVHGGWSSWEAWSACPVTCGTGMRTRTRRCDSPKPLFRGRYCEGSDKETGTCTVDPPCPIDGGWSRWTSYGRCSAPPCERGHKLRSRVCNQPRPRYGGILCRGRAVERMSCINTEECQKDKADIPVDGGWCDYGDWSDCSATCLSFSAVQVRSRSCQCPVPENGGLPCQGDELEYKQCQGMQLCETPNVSLDQS